MEHRPTMTNVAAAVVDLFSDVMISSENVYVCHIKCVTHIKRELRCAYLHYLTSVRVINHIILFIHLFI